MTQKEALKQLEKYCHANQMHLTASSFSYWYYAFVIHDKSFTGDRVIEGGHSMSQDKRVSETHRIVDMD